MAAAPGEQWEDRLVPMRVYLGGIRLLTVRLRLRTRASGFTAGVPMEQPRSPLPGVPKGLEGLLVRSLPVAGPLPRLTFVDRCLRYVPRRYERRTIDMRQPFEVYVQRFSTRSRATLRRKVRRLAAQDGGLLDVREYRRPDEMAAFQRAARRIARRTYQERLYAAALPDGVRFEREMRAIASQDRLRAFLLFFRQQPIAYLYCPAERDIVYYRYVGHDPDHAALSPGTVLLWAALERLFAEQRFSTFDFTDGDGPHKAYFATHASRCADVYFLRWSPKVIGLVVAQTAADWLSHLLSGVLRSLKLHGPIRRWLRSAGPPWPTRARANPTSEEPSA